MPIVMMSPAIKLREGADFAVGARWALGDAARLLESRTRSVEELADFFESGVATAGDVVARLER